MEQPRSTAMLFQRGCSFTLLPIDSTLGHYRLKISLLLLQAPRIVRPLEAVHVAEGSDAVLTCCICGRPAPTFEWSRAGRPVDSGRVTYDELTGNVRLEVSLHLSIALTSFLLKIFF